jgi:hypothetical protein
LTHLRPKTFKEDLYKKREIQNENDNLVLKILKLRGSQNRNESVTITGQGGTLNHGSVLKRSNSARSIRSRRSSKHKRGSKLDHLDRNYESSGSGVMALKSPAKKNF